MGLTNKQKIFVNVGLTREYALKNFQNRYIHIKYPKVFRFFLIKTILVHLFYTIFH